MKHAYLYRWRLNGDGPAETSEHCTFEDVRRDYPKCIPEPLPETLQVQELPESAEEVIEAVIPRPSGYDSDAR
jgi:hypothetical protein